MNRTNGAAVEPAGARWIEPSRQVFILLSRGP